MPTFKTADGVARLEEFMKAVGGAAKEWYVGISIDANVRLAEHGMQDSPYATWIPCEDANTARDIESHLLRTGTQEDRGDGNSDHPATQVYLFRAPRLTRFREWLKGQEQKAAAEPSRRERREEWVVAASRFIGRCEAWLRETDPEGILHLRRVTQQKAETGLGRYEVPILIVEHDEVRVHIVPFARNTHRTLSVAPGLEVPSEGRADITNGIEKSILYRGRVEGRERWYLTRDESAPVELNQDTFMAIMEDLVT